MIRRPPRSTLSSSSAASDVYKRQDGDGAMSLRELAVIRGKDQRDVGELRDIEAQSPIDEDLAWRIGQVLFCPDDVRDLHQRVVDDGREVIDGNTILTGNDKVIEFL